MSDQNQNPYVNSQPSETGSPQEPVATPPPAAPQAATPPQYSSIPPDASAPKSGKKKFLIPVIIAAALFLILLIIIIVVVVTLFSSPKAKVMKGITSTLDSVSAPLSDYLHMEALEKSISNGSYEQDIFISIDNFEDYWGYYSDISGLELEMLTRMDTPNQKMSADATLSYAGTDLLGLNIYGYDNTLAYALPEFFDGYLEMPLSDMKKTYRNSYFYDYIEEYFDMDSDIQLFNQNTSDENLTARFKARYATNLLALGNAINVTKAGTKNIKIGGSDQKCTGYEVTIPQRELQICLEDMIDFIEEESTVDPASLEQTYNALKRSIKEDVQVTVYLDKKGRAVEFNHSGSYRNMDITFSLSLLGGTNLFDDWNVDLEIEDTKYSAGIATFAAKGSTTLKNTRSDSTMMLDITISDLDYPEYDETYSIEYDSSFDKGTGNWDAAVSCYDSDDYEYLDMTCEGSFSEVTDDGFSFRLDDFTMSIDEADTILSVSGDYRLGSLKSPVASPSGTAYNVATMSEDDFYELLWEIEDKMWDSSLYDFIYNLY